MARRKHLIARGASAARSVTLFAPISVSRPECADCSAANAAFGGAPGRSRPMTVAPASSSACAQTGPRLPSAPVTTATRPSSRNRSVMKRVQLDSGGGRGRPSDELERQRLVRADVAAERLADDLIEAIGRQAVAGLLIATSAIVSTCPAGRSRAATSFFPIFSTGLASLA